MRYVIAAAVWTALSMVWGVAGAGFGPGILMFIIAVLTGSIGVLLTFALFMLGAEARAFRVGRAVAVISFLLALLLAGNGEMTWRATAYLAAFVSVPSFGISVLARITHGGSYS